MLSMLHLVDWRARHDGDRVALVEPTGRRLTYGELGEAVIDAAACWSGAGVRMGDVVAVMAGNSIEWMVQLFGLVRAGAYPAAINWRLRGPEVAGLFELLEPVAVLADEPSAAVVDGTPFAGSCFRMPGAAGSDWSSSWRHLEPGGAPPLQPVERLRPDAPLVLIHTSGTTGRPKVVPVPHQAMIAVGQVEHLTVEGMGVGLRRLNFLPLFHAAGLGNVCGGLYGANEILMLPAFEPADVVDHLVEHRIQFANMVPTAIRAVLNEVVQRDPPPDLSSLLEIVYGASPMPPELLREAMPVLGCRFRQYYGSTETGCLPVSMLEPHDHRVGAEHLGSAGRLAFGWEVRLARPDGTQAAVGEPGEILARGAAGFPGYWRDPSATAAALTDDGFYRTGDVGRLDAAGYLTLVDRAKDMIITGGENVYPAEVEAALRGHPAIAEVAVVGEQDDHWGERVVAVVVPRADMMADPDQILGWAKERLAGFKCPRRVVLVSALPLNATGKVLKRDLRAQLASGALVE